MPANQQQSVWSLYPHLDDEIRKHIKRGLSFSEIAALLGHGLSRNAVIGRAGRIGIRMPKKPGQLEADTNTRVRKRVHIGVQEQFNKVYEEKVDFSVKVDDENIPIEQRKTFGQLEPNHCRYGVGDPVDANFFFCGGEVVSDRIPYCKCHASRCYEQPSRRAASFYSYRPRV